MKKILLPLLILLSTLAPAVAQQDRAPFAANTFLSGNFGLSFYSRTGGESNSQMGFGGGVSYGKWILQPLALRVGVDAAMLTVNDESQTNLFASAELMWDIFSAFGTPNERRINVYPFVGLGVYSQMAGQSTSNIQTMLGLHVPFSLSNGWQVFAEYKSFILPHGDWVSYTHTISLGATYNFLYYPYSRRSEFATHGFSEDWFIGYAMGANVSLFNFKGWDSFDNYSLMPELMVGRNYTPRWTIRFELSGLFGRTQDQELYRFTAFHADVLFNVSNVLDFARGRRLGVMPYLGAGPVWRYDNPMFTMSADGGLFLRYYLTPQSDIFADLKYTLLPRYIAQSASETSRYGCGMASLTFGYIYNFGTSSTRYRMPVGR